MFIVTNISYTYEHAGLYDLVPPQYREFRTSNITELWLCNLLPVLVLKRHRLLCTQRFKKQFYVNGIVGK